MAKHIQEFYIKSYKGISDLYLKNLNSVNIFTGDNNSGKTSVLELISTVDNPDNTGAWIKCLRAKNRKFYNAYYNMFSIDSLEKRIDYCYVDMNGKKSSISLRADFEEKQIADDEMYKINLLKKIGDSKHEKEIIDTMCMNLSTYVNGELLNQDKIYDFQTRISHFVNKTPNFVRTIYVSPVDYSNEKLFLREILSDVELYEDLLQVLREFDDSIININAIESKESHLDVEYMILSKKHKEALPLNSYGDGMKKIVLFMSALLKAKNGILLIDEFETAIHTSAMDSIFSWLISTANKFNVQLFLTSHSKEAIYKILNVSEELKSCINLYTLYDYNNKNYVRLMSGEEAIYAQENLGVELR